jgi:hypothetical protein
MKVFREDRHETGKGNRKDKGTGKQLYMREAVRLASEGIGGS